MCIFFCFVNRVYRLKYNKFIYNEIYYPYSVGTMCTSSLQSGLYSY